MLPQPGRERFTKNDPDIWLESEQVLKAAVLRLRELKSLIELLTTSNPLAKSAIGGGPASSPVVEVELGNMLEGIAEVVRSYGGPDYTSVITQFDPVPLWQTQPFKHNKKHSAELWIVFLLLSTFPVWASARIAIGHSSRPFVRRPVSSIRAASPILPAS